MNDIAKLLLKAAAYGLNQAFKEERDRQFAELVKMYHATERSAKPIKARVTKPESKGSSRAKA